MKMLMKSKFLSLKGPVLVWMLMATVASSSLIAQPPKFDDAAITPPTNSTATSSSSSSSSSTAMASSSSSSTASNSNLLPLEGRENNLKEEGENSLNGPVFYHIHPKADYSPSKSSEYNNAYANGLIYKHVPKCGGSSTINIFCEEFHVPFERCCISGFSERECTSAINSQIFTGGHVTLSVLAASNRAQRPIVTFIRNPFQRIISHFRYWKSTAHHYPPDCPIFQMKEMNLNVLSNIRDISREIPDIYSELYFFAPPGLDVSFENMTDEKVDQCVVYALKHLAFIGEIETFADSLHRLNLALGLKLNADQEAEVRANVTPDTVEKITNPEVLAFLKERTKWATKLWEKLRAGQRWRIAMPMVQDPDMPSLSITQFILPEGFDPDMYLAGNHDLDITASEKFGSDLWKKREFALRHYVARGKTEGRHFDFFGTPKLDNGRYYPKMSFIDNARWPGLVAKTQGLSGTEPTHTWSEGPKVTFEFVTSLPKGFSVYLNVLAAFGPNEGKDFVVTVGNSVRKFQSKGWVAEEIIIPFINPTASNRLTIDIPQPTAPASLTGDVGDPRLLGLALVSLEVIPSPYPELNPVLEALESTGLSSTSSK